MTPDDRLTALLAKLEPTWPRGMYGCPDDMFARRDLQANLAAVLTDAGWVHRDEAQAEALHWKGHAEEAGDGFSRVCKDYARVSSRNVELLNRLTTAEATLARVEALAEGPTSDGYRPYAVLLEDGEEVALAVLLDDLRAALAPTEETT